VLPDNTARNTQFAVQPIDVCPRQRQAFRNSQTETNTDESYGAEWFLEFENKLLELFHGQTPRLPLPLGGTLDGHQFHGIALDGEIAPPHCKIP
jgi:hypothetical protein